MIVIDRILLTSIARSLRSELGLAGIAVGYQRSLNLLIGALDMGSPNAVAARIAHAPIPVRYHGMHWMPDTSAQLARLAAHEASSRTLRTGEIYDLVFREGSGSPLGRDETKALLAAALTGARAVFGRGGEIHRLVMPDTGEALSKVSPFVADLIPGAWPELPTVRHLPCSMRLAEVLTRADPSCPVPETVTSSALAAALRDNVDSVRSDALPYMGAIGTALDFAGAEPIMSRRQDIREAARDVLAWICSRHHSMVAMRWPDGKLQDLRWSCQPCGDDAMSPTANGDSPGAGEYDAPVLGR